MTINNCTIIENVDDQKYPKEWLLHLNDSNGKSIDDNVFTKHNIENIPTELFCIYKGFQRKVADNLPSEKPPWYDEEKFKRGQKFANDHYASVNFAEMLTLLVIFSFSRNLGPLIYTKRSDTTIKAAKRYLSTALRVLSWYEEDIWDKNSVAYENIKVVRAYHKSTTKRMYRHSKEELNKRKTLRNVLQQSDIKCQSLIALKEDFKGTCPYYLDQISSSDILINQGEMSFTLFGFMGLIILHPEKLGIIGVSQEELDGFVHLWRVLGYLLGIEDEFNMCQGSFDQVKLRCQEIVEKLFIPNLSNLSEEWEHMSRCLVEGISMIIPGPTFETTSLHLFWMTGVDPVKFKKQLKWKDIIKHYFNRITLRWMLRFCFLRTRINNWVKDQMRLKALTLLKEDKRGRDFSENI